ncbi:NAD-dependent epimerase/dehydratase family protein [Jatrophihabitans sp. YIM 134969]
MTSSAAPSVVVIGANGLVGARVCTELAERGAQIRAVVRRAGTAPELPGLEEHVGEFTDAAFTAGVLAGADAVVTTVHPMGSDRATQERIGVEGNGQVAQLASEAGVGRHVHVSTAAVYDRSPGVGDVDEDSALVPDDADDYGVTKRDTDAAIAAVDGLTRVLLRPPAILGPGPTSVWNTLRPAAARDDERARHGVPDKTFAWVHVGDLAIFAADLALGADGPAEGACTAVNVVAGSDRIRDYLEAVTRAVGVDPVWDDEPAWTAALLADRARGWGWTPRIGLPEALAELETGLEYDLQA